MAEPKLPDSLRALSSAVHDEVSASAARTADSVRFIVNHVRSYSMWGKSVNEDGHLIWSLTHELCGDPEGDRRHFERVAEMLRELEGPA